MRRQHDRLVSDGLWTTGPSDFLAIIDYPILYLAFHGESGGIAVGEARNKTLTLDHLAEQLEGACKGRVIHFGSCSTLDVNHHELNSFLRRTGACAVFGFRTDVDWLRSAAFDLLVLGCLQDVSFAG